jgi:lysophospholipase L1-like esterase
VRRVLFLGDSITFGYGVRDEEVVSERVRARLAAAGISVEVVNTGVASYNSEQEAAYYASEGRRYDPDVVVVGVCWNDINDKSEVRVAANGYLVDARNPGPASAAWSSLEFELRNFVKQSRLLYGSVERWRAYQSSRTPDDHAGFRSDVLQGTMTPRVAAGWSQMESAFTRLQRDVADRGARLLVVAFPMPLMLEGSFPESSYPARLREFTDRSGIAFLDLTDAFRSQFDGHESLFIAFDADHPNASGHDLAAREIVRMVQTWVS